MKPMQIDQAPSAAARPATDQAQAQREHEICGAKLAVLAEIAAMRRAIREHVAQERRLQTFRSSSWSGPRARSTRPGRPTWDTKVLVL